MPNKVFLNKDGIVEQTCEGDQTLASIQDLIKDTDEITAKLQEQKKKVLILTDLFRVRNADYGSKKASLAGLTKHHYDRVAIVGASPFMKLLSGSIIEAAGAAERVKNFDTRETALSWLSEGK